MPIRSFTHAGRAWRVLPSGRVTQYDRDEFALLFVSGTGDDREHSEHRTARRVFAKNQPRNKCGRYRLDVEKQRRRCRARPRQTGNQEYRRDDAPEDDSR